MSELLTQSSFALFFIVTLGLILGNFQFKGISLDVSAVLFVALLFGHLGIVIPDDFQKIGLLLFIFTIGIQAGPGFFESYRRYGLKLNIMALIVIFTGFVVTIVCAEIFHIDLNLATGLFTGALTSTPGLAAALEASKSTLASIGYGIAYPFGVLGIILFIKLIPKILRVDTTAVEKEYLQETQVDYPPIFNRNFTVENINIDGKTIAQLDIRHMTNANISRVMHNNVATTPNSKTILHLGDVIKAVGDDTALDRIQFLIGKPTQQEIPLSEGYDVQWILVTNKKVVNQTLAELNLLAHYNATVTRIRRSEIDIAPKMESRIRFGDRLMVAADKENLQRIAVLLGNKDKRLSETDFLPIALGIIIGIIIGKLQIPFIAGITIRPGNTGGVLAAALIMSRLGKTGPIIWSLSGPANQLIRQIGILFFLAAVGTEAGVHLKSALLEQGAELFLIGIVISLTSMTVGILVGRYLFKINFLTLLGVITGGMTSTPGLAAAKSITDTNAPEVAYATVYPIALVGKIVICRLIIVIKFLLGQ
jgi:putative transport protein